jgi:hypothetical protein
MSFEGFDAKHTQVIRLQVPNIVKVCLGGRQFHCPKEFKARFRAPLSDLIINFKVNDSCPAQLPAAARLNMASEDEQYHPKDAVKAAINGTLITGAAGGLVSAVQNTLTKRNVGAWGVFTRSGSTIAVFGGSCSIG